jgi:DNA-binding HxlR family transcriptional regulator
MNDIDKEETTPVITLKGYDHSKKLGNILSHEGRIQILFALQKEPKIFSELETNVEIKGTTFDKALRELRKDAHVIRKSKTFAKNRETKQYILEPIGRDLLRFLEAYERTLSKPKPNQEMLEVKNKV